MPAALTNGDVVSDGLTAFYSCDKGFSLKGVEQRYCGSGGSGWNETAPTCGELLLHSIYSQHVSWTYQYMLENMKKYIVLMNPFI